MLSQGDLKKLIDDLLNFSRENEWVEFKLNFHSAEEVGKCVSAISNSACLHAQVYGYLIFGIEDKTLLIKGTSFSAKSHKQGNEELEHWLSTRLNPKIDFRIYEFEYDTKVGAEDNATISKIIR